MPWYHAVSELELLAAGLQRWHENIASEEVLIRLAPHHQAGDAAADKNYR